MSLPTPLTLFLPWIAGAIAGWLSSARLPQWLNAIIIAVLFVASVALTAFTGGQLTADPNANMTMIIGYSAAIFGLLKPCIDFLARNTASPLSFLERAMPPMSPPQSSQAVEPVTPRASALQPGQSYTTRATANVDATTQGAAVSVPTAPEPTKE